LGESAIRQSWRLIKILLLCGIFSFVLYFAMDVVASLRYDGYNYNFQTISKLSAVGAPTRPMWLGLAIVYEVLVFAFGAGVLASAGSKRALRVVGGLLVGFGIVGLAWPFAPMHISFVFLEPSHWVMQTRQFANFKRLSEPDATQADEPS